jgi:thiopeptide-type bacteriocin biosynthesis protein
MADAAASRAVPILPAAARDRPPGSDWLFVKLYISRPLEEDLLAGPLRALSAQVAASGVADGWFFVRYNDPERHLRLRFRGQPERLLAELLPLFCTWAQERLREELCSRFVIDTYEREIERFGGLAAMVAAEALFAADSQAAVDLLQLQRGPTVGLDRIHLAVLTVDALLDGLGLDSEARFRWCRGRFSSRHAAGEEYRQCKQDLRALLDDPARLLQEPEGAAIAGILERLRACGAEYRCRLGDIAARGDLARAPGELHESIVHLHLNRLVGTDRAAEDRVMGLLWRVREGLHHSTGR